MFFIRILVKRKPNKSAMPAVIPHFRVFLNIINTIAAAMKTAPTVPESVIALKRGVKNPPAASLKRPAACAIDKSKDCIKVILKLYP